MNESIYALISKYLTGEANAEEKIYIDNWRKESTGNETLFQELRNAWILPTQSSAMLIPDKEVVWGKIRSKINAKTFVKMYPRKVLFRAISVASTIALLIGLSTSLIINKEWKSTASPLSEVIIKAPLGQKSQITLPDGTVAWLNSGTTLTYATDYNQKKREVRLEGEGFFEVVSNPQRDFIVNAGNIQIKALGTSFDVSAYAKDLAYEVTLAEGKVAILTDSGKLLTSLSPNRQAKIDKTRLSCEVYYCDAEIESLWRHGRLKIENAPMDEVILKMERWYGVTIHSKGRPSGEHHWMTIKTESLKEMLELVNKITPIDYTIKGEEVTLTYK